MALPKVMPIGTASGKTAFDYSTFNLDRRLWEIAMFFQKNDPVHQSLRRMAKRLERAGIPYAVMGAMAVNLHGARRTTDDVDVLLTKEGLERFRNEMLPRFYKPVEGRPRRFEERKSGVHLDCLVTGLYPGKGRPGPFAFPDPSTNSEEIEKIRVITLPQLIQLKLAARRYYDFGDVVFLIKVHNLDESYLPHLHPSIHQDFIECLEEKSARMSMRRERADCRPPCYPRPAPMHILDLDPSSFPTQAARA